MKLAKHCVITFLCASTLVFAQDAPVPKYVERARELVATVKPENNHYAYSGLDGVRWKDDGAPENSVYAACGGLVNAVLIKGGRRNVVDEIMSKTNQYGHKYRQPHIRQWLEAANKNIGMTRVESLNDVRVGDFFVYECKRDKCSNSYGDVAGHVAIVDAKPVKRTSLFGVAQWDVAIIDSAERPHGPDDTRSTGQTGVGRVTYHITSDENGIPTGHTVGKRFVNVEGRALTFSRPQY